MWRSNQDQTKHHKPTTANITGTLSKRQAANPSGVISGITKAAPSITPSAKQVLTAINRIRERNSKEAAPKRRALQPMRFATLAAWSFTVAHMRAARLSRLLSCLLCGSLVMVCNSVDAQTGAAVVVVVMVYIILNSLIVNNSFLLALYFVGFIVRKYPQML